MVSCQEIDSTASRSFKWRHRGNFTSNQTTFPKKICTVYTTINKINKRCKPSKRKIASSEALTIYSCWVFRERPMAWRSVECHVLQKITSTSWALGRKPIPQAWTVTSNLRMTRQNTKTIPFSISPRPLETCSQFKAVRLAIWVNPTCTWASRTWW